MLMLHSHGIKQTVHGKPDVMEVDESRTVKFDKAVRNLHPDVTSLLKCLMQGENMAKLNNEKLFWCNIIRSCIYHSLKTNQDVT